MNIGIIGQGFVGNAVYQKFKNFYEVLTYDLQRKLCNSSLVEVHMNCDYIFVCLPTPMGKEGSCHTGIVEEALEELNKYCKLRICQCVLSSEIILFRGKVGFSNVIALAGCVYVHCRG